MTRASSRRPALGACLALAVLGALPACDKTHEPEGSGSPGVRSAIPLRPPPVSTTHAPRPSGPSDVGYDAPGTWTRAETPGPMRKATYYVPRAPGDSEEGEMSVSQAGGSVEQNIARWALQLGKGLTDVKRTPKSVNGLVVTVVEIHGEYMPMSMPGAPQAGRKPGFELLGAIVETSPPTFLKMVGPEKTVAAAQPDFDKMVDSLHAK